VDSGKMNTINKKFVLTYLCVFFCFLYFLGCATSLAPITDKSGDADFAQLLETIRQKEKLPAIAASVIIDGNIYVKAAVGTRKYGTNDWVTMEDKFLIGSCGKTFTATLAAILIEKGFLEWDTTVQDVFPELKMQPEWENITIQQLLSNRSGYVDDSSSHLLPSEELTDLWDSNSSLKKIRLIYSERAFNHKPIHPPDEVIVYANSGFLIAGSMLEKVTNKNFEILMDEQLFQSLGLKSAGYGSPAANVPISEPHGHVKGVFFYVPVRQDLPDFIAPMGNVAISIGDWSKFVMFHLGNHQDSKNNLLGSGTIKKLHTPPNSAKWNYEAHKDADTNTLNYALGWFTEKKGDGNILIGHKGRGKSFTAVVHTDPRNKNAILLMTNAKVDHIHLLRAAEAIKNYYPSQVNLPIVNMPTHSVWQ
jgi:CubicO group peptidase (beta-lactamase class C family)